MGLGSATDIEIVGDELPVIEDYVVNRAHGSTTGVGSQLRRSAFSRLGRTSIHERCTRAERA